MKIFNWVCLVKTTISMSNSYLSFIIFWCNFEVIVDIIWLIKNRISLFLACIIHLINENGICLSWIMFTNIGMMSISNTFNYLWILFGMFWLFEAHFWRIWHYGMVGRFQCVIITNWILQRNILIVWFHLRYQIFILSEMLRCPRI